MMTKKKHIKIPITEHDLDLFKQLVEDGNGFAWSIDDVVVEFVSNEHTIRELKQSIEELEQAIQIGGHGSNDLRMLDALKKELEDLE